MPINPATTNLSDKDYSGRSLRGVQLVQFRLMRANFSGADLTLADLTGANVTGTLFTGAVLDKAIFTNAFIEVDGKEVPMPLAQLADAKSQEGIVLTPEPPAPVDVAALIAAAKAEEAAKHQTDLERLQAQLEAALLAAKESAPPAPVHAPEPPKARR